MTPAAVRHLSKTDPVMRALIRRVGPCTIRVQRRWSPFQSLVRAVVYQQLHGRAAAAILARLVALFPGAPGIRGALASAPDDGVLVSLARRRARESGEKEAGEESGEVGTA